MASMTAIKGQTNEARRLLSTVAEMARWIRNTDHPNTLDALHRQATSKLNQASLHVASAQAEVDALVAKRRREMFS